MREIQVDLVRDAVARLFVEACYHLGQDVLDALGRALSSEPSPVGRYVLKQILRNAEIASAGELPLCQDTGLAVVFLDLGQDVHLVGGGLNEAIEEGVRRGYGEGYLRKSAVDHPFSQRTNTGDNSPPIIHTTIVPGERIKVVAVPK